MGEDCSTDLFGVPHDLILGKDGLCDRSKRLCETTIVSGLGFSNDFGNASCKLREFILEVGDRLRLQAIRFKGLY